MAREPLRAAREPKLTEDIPEHERHSEDDRGAATA
jgi:hypothetical protein